MTNDGSTLAIYPTAFLIVRNPPLYSTVDYYTDITCSVSADWVPGTHITEGLVYESTTTQRGSIDQHDVSLLKRWISNHWADHDLGPPPVFEKPTAWRPIEMTTDWLDMLTPVIDADMPDRTTLASVLETVLGQVEIDWHQWAAWNLFPDSPIFERFTSLIAGFVADGLSRVGWDENHAYNLRRDTVFNIAAGDNVSLPGWNYGRDSWDNVWSRLILNKAELMPNAIYKAADGNMHTLHVTITGYGMSADDIAYRLAIAVLYVYLALVACHIFLVVRKKYSSNCWASLSELVVLAGVSSPPARVLSNTGTGVKSHRTWALPVFIRSPKVPVSGEESVQFAFGTSNGDLIEEGRKYGVT